MDGISPGAARRREMKSQNCRCGLLEFGTPSPQTRVFVNEDRKSLQRLRFRLRTKLQQRLGNT